MPTKNKTQKLVPALRFPEFRGAGEWEEKPLHSLSNRLRRKVGTKKLTPVSITAGVGFVDQTKKFGRRIAGEQYKNYIHIERGDFVYNKGNSKTFAQGCIYQLREFDEAAASTAFICFKLNEDCVDQYFQSLFECNTHGRKLQKFITSGARSDGLLNINPTDFFSIELPVPPRKPEQQKIADCLGSLDELLAAHRRKLAALQDHKKGLLQQLFPAEGETTPYLRFPEFEGEWEVKRISELGKVVTGSTPSTKRSDFYKGSKLFVSPADISETRFVERTNTTLTDLGFAQTRKIAKHSILFVCIGSTIGKIAQNSEECATNQQINSLVPHSNHDNGFVYFCLSRHAGTIAQMAANQAVPIINKTLFSSFEILVPSLPEQQKIADCLSALDALITAQTEQIAALQAHKKGLMQQLFPNPDGGA